MRFSARIDAGRTTEEFRSARVQINRRVRTGIQNCVERIALPRVRAFAKAPAAVRAALIARATGTSGFITTGGSRKLDRILGLLNFGGTVRGTIRPTPGRSGSNGHAPALKTSNGYFAAIHGPRHYSGRHFLEEAVESAIPEYEEEMLNEITQVFE